MEKSILIPAMLRRCGSMKKTKEMRATMIPIDTMQSFFGEGFIWNEQVREECATEVWVYYTDQKAQTQLIMFHVHDPRDDLQEKDVIQVGFYPDRYTEEMRFVCSEICHEIAKWIAAYSVYRQEIASGEIEIWQGWDVIKDVNLYQKRKAKEAVYELQKELLNVYEQTVIQPLPSVVLMDEGKEVDDYSWELQLLGQDGEHLAHLLRDMGIANFKAYESTHIAYIEPCYSVMVLPTPQNKPARLVSFWHQVLSELGFCVTLYGKPLRSS